MKQQDGACDVGIELFISIPIHGSDPLYLSALQGRSRCKSLRSVKRRARSSDVVMVGRSAAAKQAKSLAAVASMKRRFHKTCDSMQTEPCFNGVQKNRVERSDMKQDEDICSPTSSSSSMSDLFTFDEGDIMEFIDERIKPRFRLLRELY